MEYDWGSGQAGNLLRQTNTGWLQTNSVNNTNYTALPNYIIDRKSSETIQDGSSNTVAQITYEYDNYATAMTASGATQHDSTFTTSYKVRGNVTKTSHWLNTNSTWLNTTHTYDDAGNVLSVTDPNTNKTTFSYADNFTDGTNHNTAAYVTQTTLPATNGVSHVSRKQYYYNSGLAAASCGENFPSGTACTNAAALPQPDYATTTYDMLGRPQTTTVGDQGQTTICYSDLPGTACSTGAQFSTQVTQIIASGLNKVSLNLMDGMDNTVQTQLASDPEGADYVDTTYDGIGRKKTVSNPHRSAALPTDGSTTYNYDGLSRTVSVVEPDGSTAATSYAGNSVTVSDETGKQRKSVSDGLGRLTQVFEDPAVLNYETDYQYDTLNNLIRVDQKGSAPTDSTKWRTRTFTYDSLSRLVCAANPEIQIVTCPSSPAGPFPAGAATYTYDSDGNALTKQSPQPNQTNIGTTETVTYSYDALNRLTQKTYTGLTMLPLKYGYDGSTSTGCGQTPPVITFSNPIGRMTGMCAGFSGSSWSYDPMGRALLESRINLNPGNGPKKTVGYSYYLDGSLKTLTYPSGHVLTYTVGAAGRVTQATDPNNNYVMLAKYAPHGALASMTNGSGILHPIPTTTACSLFCFPLL